MFCGNVSHTVWVFSKGLIEVTHEQDFMVLILEVLDELGQVATESVAGVECCGRVLEQHHGVLLGYCCHGGDALGGSVGVADHRCVADLVGADDGD